MEEAEDSTLGSSEEHDDSEPEEESEIDDSWINDLLDRATAGEFDFDDIMTSATNAR